MTAPTAAAHHYPAPIADILAAQEAGAVSLLDDSPCPYSADTEKGDFLRQMWCRGRVAGLRAAGEADENVVAFSRTR